MAKKKDHPKPFREPIEMAEPEFQVLEISTIQAAPQNPRTDATSDLAGLSASMASEQEPFLVQVPIVEQLSDGSYRIISGERRVRAATMAGWQTIACLVMPPTDAITTHTLRVVENMHRAELHPLDNAIALKIAWYAANGIALEVADATHGIMSKEQSPYETLKELEQLTKEHGFTPTKPPVSWQALLDRLGLAINKERLKKLLRVLNLAPEVLDIVRPFELSEASLRALGTLKEEEQLVLAKVLQQDEQLRKRVPRIARRVNQKKYPIAKAIAESQGRVYDPDHPEGGELLDISGLFKTASVEGPKQDGKNLRGYEADEDEEDYEADEADEDSESDDIISLSSQQADAILRLLELSEQLRQTSNIILSQISKPSALASPWGDIVDESTQIIQGIIDNLAGDADNNGL